MTVGCKCNESGFSLIELMVVVAVIGILAMVAYPSYMDSIRKSRRADAMAALSAAQLAQEKYRANNPSYGTREAAGIAASSPDNFYGIAVSNVSAITYTITANGQNGQDNDTGCTNISVDQAGVLSPPSCVSR